MTERYLDFDVATLERELAFLIETYPELADDEDLRADTIEGETNAIPLLSRIIGKHLDAKSMADATGERLADLQARKARLTKRADALRGLAHRLMTAGDLRKITLPDATLSIGKKAAGVVVMDETVLPDAFVRVKKEPDRTAIKAALVAGHDVPGALLSNGGETLTVRVR